jgi:hypothetical protein
MHEVFFMLHQFQYPVWQEPFLAAMREMDSNKAKVKIATAEIAIHSRMIRSRAEPAEREAILNALNALKFIKRLESRTRRAKCSKSQSAVIS